MPFPKQPCEDAAVEQQISPQCPLQRGNQHTSFLSSVTPRIFYPRQHSKMPYTTWLHTSSLSSAAGNKEGLAVHES